MNLILNTQHRHAEEDSERSPPLRTGGAAIAPPPSLQETEPVSNSPPPPLPTFEKPEKPLVVGGYGANSVAAKIMAKYGFKVIIIDFHLN